MTSGLPRKPTSQPRIGQLGLHSQLSQPRAEATPEMADTRAAELEAAADQQQILAEAQQQAAQLEAAYNNIQQSGTARDPHTARRMDELIGQIQKVADQLATEETSLGDLKILARTLGELRHAFRVFQPYRLHRKVTVFGSARTQPEEPAYQQGVKFGRQMAQQDWLVLTGAASGIMEAAHVGAGRDSSLGVNIMLPFEQSANPIVAGDSSRLVDMRYFFTRKLMFVKECDGFCLLPGGFGTLDEALEVLTLLQTGKRELVPVVLLDPPGGDFWSDFDRFVHRRLLASELISPEDLNLYRRTDSVDEAVSELLAYYRNYHSQRFVGTRLALRLHHAPDGELLKAINVHFSDILVDGHFSLRGPSRVEQQDEPELNDLSRLVFHFNRRNLGRLRVLIDSLNAGRILRGVEHQSPNDGVVLE